MREYLKKLKPTSISDLSAMNALYRPGPMDFIDDFILRKHGTKKTTFMHPILETILAETCGIIVYQEQVIQIANKVAGMSLAEADLLRRAMGKKDMKAMAEQKEKFTRGAVKNNIEKKIAEEIFEAIDKFANYGFNKSHSVAYSIVAYQTAYLKAHYTEEFLAANLSNEFGNTVKVTTLLEDCRKLNIKVLPPDINNPSVKFKVKNKKIIFGMSAIKNVGINAVEAINSAHVKLERNFKSIYDFCSNVDTRLVNKRALEGLVLAGAFDAFKGSRAQHFMAIEEALMFGNKVNSSKKSDNESLFGGDSDAMDIHEPELPDVRAWETKEKLTKEREVLGFYLTDHPLHKYDVEYISFATVHLGEEETYQFNEPVRACGVITEVRTKIDKAGRKMAFFKLDDFSGSCECLTFSKVYSACEELIEPESTVMVTGKLESSGDAVKLHVDSVHSLDTVKEKFTKRIGIILDRAIHADNIISEIKKLMEDNEGSIPVNICLKENGITREFYVAYKIALNSNFIPKVKKLLGDESVVYFAV
jgi:DNA polymerase-3 subunit alpha